MPAINVARTDTFEVQRQKINQLGNQIFNISEGGSDLSTGNLKLGDGTRGTPSLAFASDVSLGLYKNAQNELGFVSNSKKVLDLKLEESVFYKNTVVRRNTITTSGVTITQSGSGYDIGSYSDVALLGGSGSGSTASVNVVSYDGSITTNGDGYTPGNYTDVPLTGGNGAGAVADVVITSVEGTITNAGSGYTDGIYSDVGLTGGSGVGVTAEFDIVSGVVDSIVITPSTGDGGYTQGEVLSVAAADVGGTGAGFQFTISSNPGTVETFSVSLYDDGNTYQSGDILSLDTSVVGTPSTPFQYTIGNVGIIDNVSITNSGLGYNDNDTLSLNPTDLSTNIEYAVTVVATQLIEFSSNTVASSVFTKGNDVQGRSGQVEGVGLVDVYTGSNNQTYNNVSLPGASGTGLVIDFITNTEGELEIANVVSNGFDYTTSEVINIPSGSIGGISGAQVTIQSASAFTAVPCYEVFSTGSFIDAIVVGNDSFDVNDQIFEVGNSNYQTITGVTSANQYLLDDGTGDTPEDQYNPLFTLYSGNTYRFIYSDSSNSGHIFALSRTPGGEFGTVSQSGVTLSTSSKTLTVADTTSITVGMTVSISGGSGVLEATAVVESIVNGTSLTLDSFPTGDGTADLTFTGVEYSEGTFKGADYLDITINDSTPNIYFYCTVHSFMGGYSGYESVLSTNTNNPKVFGSGFELTIDTVSTLDSVLLNVSSGDVAATSFTGNSASISSLVSNASVTTPLLEGTTINGTSLNSTTSLSITSVNGTTVTGNLDIGTTIQTVSSTGSITTSGELKTNGTFNSSDKLVITDSDISSTVNNSITITPSTNQVVKVASDTALIIPSGLSAERPTSLAENGAIRFNTENGQYEGYSAATTSWSSLGGVRDIDGNTYIEAEATTGANDNTLYFYNDGNNTVQITPQKLDFLSVKTISSSKVGLPTHVVYSSNQNYGVGDYARYEKNLYEVTVAGTSGTSGNEPVHTSGAALSGTVEFTWFAIAVDDLTFNQIDELKLSEGTQLSIDGELRLVGNTISTDVSDLIITPNSGRKVQIVSTSSLAIPSGQTGQRGTPASGSIRYNTDIDQYEGYIASNAKWSSLGGVRDVDGNTYIIPESIPGANENTLYFYNDGSNSLDVDQQNIILKTVNRIESSGLEIDCPELTFASQAMTIRNDQVNTTDSFIFSSRDNLDIGHSTGLVTTPLLRLTNTGEVQVNTGFGTSSSSYTKVLDETLTLFNLRDVETTTAELSLEKDVTNTGTYTIFNPAEISSAKMIVSIHNQSSNHRQINEYLITHYGTDIFHTEYGDLNTGEIQASPTFDFDGNGSVIVTFTLNSGLTANNVVNITVVVNSIRN